MNAVDNEIASIQRDPKYIALKNKTRSKQDNDAYNLYLRRLEKLEGQRPTSSATKTRKTSGNVVLSKPTWKNQPKTVAHRNQNSNVYTKNWVKDGTPLNEVRVVKPPVVEEHVVPLMTPGVVIPDNKKVQRTPTELQKLKEKKLVKPKRVAAPSRGPTPRQKLVTATAVKKVQVSTTRKTAPPVKSHDSDSSDEAEKPNFDNLDDSDNSNNSVDVEDIIDDLDA